MFQWPSTWHKTKTNYNKPYTIDPEICSILFFQKGARGLELVSPARFVHDFSRKRLLMLHSIK